MNERWEKLAELPGDVKLGVKTELVERVAVPKE
jgi:hypothetical protein